MRYLVRALPVHGWGVGDEYFFTLDDGWRYWFTISGADPSRWVDWVDSKSLEDQVRLLQADLESLDLREADRLLRQATRDRDKRIRQWGIAGLVDTKAEDIEPIVRRAMQDEDPGVRMNAAEAVKKRELRALVPFLEEMALKDVDEYVRSEAARSLAALATQKR